MQQRERTEFFFLCLKVLTWNYGKEMPQLVSTFWGSIRCRSLLFPGPLYRTNLFLSKNEENETTPSLRTVLCEIWRL